MKVVINMMYGGFELSEEAYKELGLEYDGYGFAFDKDRSNPKLVAVVEKLGQRAGKLANLKIVEIPDGVEWEIEEHDGMEWVSEKHRTWTGSVDVSEQEPVQEDENDEGNGDSRKRGADYTIPIRRNMRERELV
jgi:hypothetical protein